METILKSLSTISNYPIPSAALAECALGAGLDPDAEVDTEVRQSKAYKAARANVYFYLATAPNISQGGVNFSFDTQTREQFRNIANKLQAEANETANGSGYYGYQGEDF